MFKKYPTISLSFYPSVFVLNSKFECYATSLFSQWDEFLEHTHTCTHTYMHTHHVTAEPIVQFPFAIVDFQEAFLYNLHVGTNWHTNTNLN
jgi:hypothetical protein